MLNPVFHRDTRFLDQHPDGSMSYRVTERPIALEGGVRVHPLDERQPLFTIETESGATVTLSPESVFALRKTPDGRLIRYLPVDESFSANPPTLDWHGGMSGDLKQDIRRFAIVGMIVANGLHSTESGRASNLSLPTGPLADGLCAFLDAAASAQDHGQFGKPRRATVRHHNDGTSDYVFVKSRVLTNCASRLIEPKTQELQFDPLALERSDLWAFAFGLLNAARFDGRSIFINHRSVTTLRAIAQSFELRFGISCHVSEGQFHREVTTQKSGAHKLTLDGTALARARLLGLIDFGKDADGGLNLFQAEKIVRLHTIEQRSPAVIITGEREDRPPLTANTFVFDSTFEMQDGLADLAAHPLILTDSSDPASLLETAPVHFVRGNRLND